jgi:hypothetical protein
MEGVSKGRGKQVFGPMRAFCQSCGVPLSKDEKGRGSETDGRKSTDYCSHFYQMGQFTDPYLPVEEMVAMVQGVLRKMHISRFLVKKFTKAIPQSEGLEVRASVTLNGRTPPVADASNTGS